MKIALFGATGGTGRWVIERAIAAGHEVVAVARRPEAVKAKNHNLRVVKGDVLDATSLAPALEGVQVAIVTIGPSNNKEPGTLISDGVRNILEGCARTGAKRIVFESGLMLSDGSELSLLGRIGVSIYRAMYRKLHDDKVKAEAAIRQSALDWVIVRPPALDQSAATESYQVGPAMRVNPAKSLSHEDVADFLVKAASDPGWTKHTVNIGH